MKYLRTYESFTKSVDSDYLVDMTADEFADLLKSELDLDRIDNLLFKNDRFSLKAKTNGGKEVYLYQLGDYNAGAHNDFIRYKETGKRDKRKFTKTKFLVDGKDLSSKLPALYKKYGMSKNEMDLSQFEIWAKLVK